MTKSPLINALAAAGYIAIVASIMFYAPKFIGKADTLLVPVAIVSLFTLSAAVMGYLFLYQPLQFYFEGEKKVAVNLFLKTIAIFAFITAVIFLSFFFL